MISLLLSDHRTPVRLWFLASACALDTGALAARRAGQAGPARFSPARGAAVVSGVKADFSHGTVVSAMRSSLETRGATAPYPGAACPPGPGRASIVKVSSGEAASFPEGRAAAGPCPRGLLPLLASSQATGDIMPQAECRWRCCSP